jgi:signal transduction histidine kinase
MRTAGVQPGLDLELVDVRMVVDQVVEEFRSSSELSNRSIEILGEFDTILARPLSLTHIFRNLLANALKHNHEQDNLVVEVGQRNSNGGNVTTFFVRDNGKGIDSEHRERIFSPFHRGPDSPESGLGLGLALVDMIVTQEGGQVWVEESSCGGAAFCFTLSPTSSESNDDG